MKSFKNRFISSLLALLLGVEIFPIDAVAALNLRADPAKVTFSPFHEEFESQAVSQELLSGWRHMFTHDNFSNQATPNVRDALDMTGARAHHRPGTLRTRMAEKIRWIPGAYPLIARIVKKRQQGHDDLSSRTEVTLTKFARADWKNELENRFPGFEFEIVPNDDPEHALGQMTAPDGTRYTPLAKSLMTSPSRAQGFGLVSIKVPAKGKIFLKESIWSIQDVPARNKLLADLISHEIAEIKLKGDERPWLTRLLLWTARAIFRIHSLDEQWEYAARFLRYLYLDTARRETNELLKVPPITKEVLLEQALRHVPPSESQAARKLILAAYKLAGNKYRLGGKDRLYPSGRSYFEHATNVALSAARSGQSPEVIAAALLHKLPELLDTSDKTEITLQGELLDTMPAETRGIEGYSVGTICNLVRALDRLNRRPFNPDFGDGTNYVAEKLINYEVQRIQSVARAHDVNYPALAALALADGANILSTIDPKIESARMERTCRFIQFVMAPFAERHGLPNLASEMYNDVFRHENPTLYARVRAAFRAAIGLSHRQAQSELTYLTNQLDTVLKSAQFNVGPKLVSGREKSYYSAYEKEEAEGVPIAKMKDLMGLMVVVKTPEEMERIRHSLDSAISAGQRQMKRMGQETKTFRDPNSGRIGFQISKFEYKNPYEPKKLVTVELQIMTEEYYRYYISGHSPVDYRRPHWQEKLKRIIDNFNKKLLGPRKSIAGKGQQFAHQDLPLTADFTEDAQAIANGLEDYVYVQVARTPLSLGDLEHTTGEDLENIKWDFLRLPKVRVESGVRNPIVADAAFHPLLAIDPTSYHEMVRATPIPDPNDPQKTVLKIEPLRLESELLPGDILLFNKGVRAGYTPQAMTETQSKVASPWAYLSLDRANYLSRHSDHNPANPTPNETEWIAEGKKYMTAEYGNLVATKFEAEVIDPACLWLGFSNHNDFYASMGLAEKARIDSTLVPFQRLKEDFERWLILHYVTFNITLEPSGDSVKVALTLDEDQVGIFEDVLTIIHQCGGTVRQWGQSTSGNHSTLSLLIQPSAGSTIVEKTNLLDNLETRLRAVRRLRGDRPPPDHARRLQIKTEFSDADTGLLQFAQSMANLGIDIEFGHSDPNNARSMECIVIVPRTEVQGEEQNAIARVEQAMQGLLTRGQVNDFEVHNAPLSDATMEETLRILRAERAHIPEEYRGEWPVDREPNYPAGMQPIERKGPIDDTFISDVYRARDLLYRYFGHPTEPGHLRRRNGAPFVIHLFAAADAHIHEARFRHPRSILRLMLHDSREELWQIIENILTSNIDKEAAIRRLQTLFPSVTESQWRALSATLGLPNEQKEPALTKNLEHEILPIALEDFDVELRKSFPMYGDELIDAIKSLEPEQFSELVQAETPRSLRRDGAKLADREHNMRTHENPLFKISETIRFFLPIIMKPYNEKLTTPESVEEYVMGRRHFLRTLVAQTNLLPALIPYMEDWEDPAQAHAELLGTLEKFLKFMRDPRNEPVFNQLMSPDDSESQAQLAQFQQRLEALSQWLHDLDAEENEPDALDGPSTPSGGSGRHGPSLLDKNTALALNQFLIAECRLLPPSAWSHLPFAPDSKRAQAIMNQKSGPSNEQFMADFRKVWNIVLDFQDGFHDKNNPIGTQWSNQQLTSDGSPVVSDLLAVTLTLLNDAKVRDGDALLACPARLLLQDGPRQMQAHILKLVEELGTTRNTERTGTIRARLEEFQKLAGLSGPHRLSLDSAVLLDASSAVMLTRIRGSVSFMRASRLIDNLQLLTQGKRETTAQHINRLRRNSSRAITAVHILGMAQDLPLRGAEPAETAQALRNFGLLVPGAHQAGAGLLATRYFLSLFIANESNGSANEWARLFRQDDPQEAARTANDIRAFLSWTEEHPNYLPLELGEKVETLRIRLDRLAQLLGQAPPPDDSASRLTAVERERGRRAGLLAGLLALAVFIGPIFFGNVGAALWAMTGAPGVIALGVGLAAILWVWQGHRATNRLAEMWHEYGHYVTAHLLGYRDLEVREMKEGPNIGGWTLYGRAPGGNVIDVIADPRVQSAGPIVSAFGVALGALGTIATWHWLTLLLHSPPKQALTHILSLVAAGVLLTFLAPFTASSSIFSFADNTAAGGEPLSDESSLRNSAFKGRERTLSFVAGLSAARMVAFIFERMDRYQTAVSAQHIFSSYWAVVFFCAVFAWWISIMLPGTVEGSSALNKKPISVETRASASRTGAVMGLVILICALAGSVVLLSSPAEPDLGLLRLFFAVGIFSAAFAVSNTILMRAGRIRPDVHWIVKDGQELLEVRLKGNFPGILWRLLRRLLQTGVDLDYLRQQNLADGARVLFRIREAVDDRMRERLPTRLQRLAITPASEGLVGPHFLVRAALDIRHDTTTKALEQLTRLLTKLGINIESVRLSPHSGNGGRNGSRLSEQADVELVVVTQGSVDHDALVKHLKTLVQTDSKDSSRPVLQDPPIETVALDMNELTAQITKEILIEALQDIHGAGWQPEGSPIEKWRPREVRRFMPDPGVYDETFIANLKQLIELGRYFHAVKNEFHDPTIPGTSWPAARPQYRKSDPNLAAFSHPLEAAYNRLATGDRNPIVIMDLILHDSEEDAPKQVWLHISNTVKKGKTTLPLDTHLKNTREAFSKVLYNPVRPEERPDWLAEFHRQVDAARDADELREVVFAKVKDILELRIHQRNLACPETLIEDMHRLTLNRASQYENDIEDMAQSEVRRIERAKMEEHLHNLRTLPHEDPVNERKIVAKSLRNVTLLLMRDLSDLYPGDDADRPYDNGYRYLRMRYLRELAQSAPLVNQLSAADFVQTLSNDTDEKESIAYTTRRSVKAINNLLAWLDKDPLVQESFEGPGGQEDLKNFKESLTKLRDRLLPPPSSPILSIAAQERWITFVSIVAGLFSLFVANALHWWTAGAVFLAAELFSWFHAEGHLALDGKIELSGRGSNEKTKSYFMRGLHERPDETLAGHRWKLALFYGGPGFLQSLVGAFLLIINSHGPVMLVSGVVMLTQGALTLLFGIDHNGLWRALRGQREPGMISPQLTHILSQLNQRAARDQSFRLQAGKIVRGDPAGAAWIIDLSVKTVEQTATDDVLDRITHFMRPAPADREFDLRERFIRAFEEQLGTQDISRNISNGRWALNLIFRGVRHLILEHRMSRMLDLLNKKKAPSSVLPHNNLLPAVLTSLGTSTDDSPHSGESKLLAAG